MSATFSRRRFLALPLLLLPSGAGAATSTAIPVVAAKAVMVIDAATGQTLYQKSPDEQRQVASTQKLMTALILCEAGNLDRLATVAEYDTLAEPTKIYIKPGEQYKRRELMKALLVKSANDSARCLARNHAGTEAAFATLMNKRGALLGMTNSSFKNASGLPAENQHSSARDMARLARAALNQPVIRNLVCQKDILFTHADGRTKKLENTNRLLTDSPYCRGMKTGYTDSAGKCLICCGTHRGRTVICVILGDQGKTIWKDSKALLHWALGVA